MGIEENKATLQRYFDELMNDGDYSKADEIIHEEYEGLRADTPIQAELNRGSY